MSIAKSIFLPIVICALAGCASFGLQAPTTTADQVAYAYSGITAALNTLASATSSGLISSSDATRLNGIILGAKSELDVARADLSSDLPAAQKALLTATSVMSNVSAYLACKQAKEPSCQL